MNTEPHNPKNSDTLLEQEIENAIRARGLKEAMQQWEKENKLNNAAPASTEESTPEYNHPKSRIRPIWRVFMSFGAAAAVLVLVFFTLPQSFKRDTYRWAYREYAKYFKHTTPRPKTDNAPPDTFYALAAPAVEELENKYESIAPAGADTRMHEAVADVQYGRYVSALTIILELKENITIENEDDLLFLEAVCEASLSNTRRAKEIFSELIVKSETYKDLASQLTNELSN